MHLYVHSGKFGLSPNAIFILNYHETELSMNILATHFYKKIIIERFQLVLDEYMWTTRTYLCTMKLLRHINERMGTTHTEFLTKVFEEGLSNLFSLSQLHTSVDTPWYRFINYFFFFMVCGFFCSFLRCMLIGFACLFPMFVSLFAFPFFCLTRNFTIVQVFLFQELVPVPK